MNQIFHLTTKICDLALSFSGLIGMSTFPRFVARPKIHLITDSCDCLHSSMQLETAECSHVVILTRSCPNVKINLKIGWKRCSSLKGWSHNMLVFSIYFHYLDKRSFFFLPKPLMVDLLKNLFFEGLQLTIPLVFFLPVGQVARRSEANLPTHGSIPGSSSRIKRTISLGLFEAGDLTFNLGLEGKGFMGIQQLTCTVCHANSRSTSLG